MTDKAPWSFYGRRAELQQMQRILGRRRWFFLQISGRRRIGKTALKPNHRHPGAGPSGHWLAVGDVAEFLDDLGLK